MADNPYTTLPPQQVWSTGVAGFAADELDPVAAVPFTLAPNDPVASAGTDFALHLGPHLRQAGYNYLQPEPPLGAGEPGYSARYGNIPTTRQLRQLLLGAYGLHRPAIRAWRRGDGRYIDPLRPQLFAAGFSTPNEVADARISHLAAVRRVFQDCRVLVYTLGATETWLAPDGTALPLHPGLVECSIVEGEVSLANLTAAEMRQDLSEFIADLVAVNPDVRVILTVSPVPPVATCQARHVLTAHGYSHAARRVAAEEVAAAHENVAYFPIDDIATGGIADGGMAHMLRLFADHFMTAATPADAPRAATDAAAVAAMVRAADRQAAAEAYVAPTAGEIAVPAPPAAAAAGDEAEGEAVNTGSLPLEIELRGGGQGHEYLIAGWSFPEIEYAWTLGKRAYVRLPSGGVNCDCALKFRAGPMVHLGMINFQRLLIDVNGTVVARLVGRQPGQFEVLVPAAAVRGRPSVDITFIMPDAVSPLEAGISGDQRELGFWFSSLRLEALQSGPSFAPPPPVADDVAAPEAADVKTVMNDLHSLGINCELGFVQRAHGAEPLGLLRWAQTPLPNLLRALEARFEGLGDPAYTVIKVDGASEFQIIDKKFGFRNHSFAFQNQGATEEKVRERELVRMPFLARLLVEELEQAEKLFCFHDAGQSGLDDIERLLAALEAYGPNWLLWVCPAETSAKVGTAEILHDRLIRGYIDRFNPLTDVSAPSVEAWTATATMAHRLWRGAVGK
jgi:hypothetical protein